MSTLKSQTTSLKYWKGMLIPQMIKWQRKDGERVLNLLDPNQREVCYRRQQDSPTDRNSVLMEAKHILKHQEKSLLPSYL